MEKPLISVIIPCYKVEQYLHKCIDSILIQSYTNIEIILIDDGSPDQSGHICDMYAQKDSRIKVIHKSNGGLSDARNKGIDIAHGEYLTFIDSDDYISKDYIEVLYNLLKENNAQISICLPCCIDINGKVISKKIKVNEKKTFNSDEALISMFYQKDFDTSAWGKLYHNSLFKEIRYPLHILYEDLPTTYRLIQLCKTIVLTTQQNYFYLIRDNSIEGSPFKPIKLQSFIKIVHQLENVMPQMKKSVQKALICRIVSFAFHILLDVPKEEKDARKLLLRTIRKYRNSIINDKNSRKKTKMACILSYFGSVPINILATKGKSRIN